MLKYFFLASFLMPLLMIGVAFFVGTDPIDTYNDIAQDRDNKLHNFVDPVSKKIIEYIDELELDNRIEEAIENYGEEI